MVSMECSWGSWTYFSHHVVIGSDQIGVHGLDLAHRNDERVENAIERRVEHGNFYPRVVAIVEDHVKS